VKLTDLRWSEELEAVRVNGLQPTARLDEYQDARSRHLEARERALERREGRLRASWLWWRCSVALFGVAILAVLAAAPLFLQWADQMWMHSR